MACDAPGLITLYGASSSEEIETNTEDAATIGTLFCRPDRLQF